MSKQPNRVADQAKTGWVPPEVQPFLPWIHSDRLSCRQVAVMLTVKANPGFSTGAIAKLLGLNKPSITRATDKLVKMGLLRRTTSMADQRMVELWPAAARKKSRA